VKIKEVRMFNFWLWE